MVFDDDSIVESFVIEERTQWEWIKDGFILSVFAFWLTYLFL